MIGDLSNTRTVSKAEGAFRKPDFPFWEVQPRAKQRSGLATDHFPKQVQNERYGIVYPRLSFAHSSRSKDALVKFASKLDWSKCNLRSDSQTSRIMMLPRS